MVFLLSILNPEMINCCCSVAQSCPDLCDPMDCNIPGFPVLHYFLVLPQFMSIESVMLSNHFTLWCLLLHLPSIFQASGSFIMSRLFASGGQSIGASASASVLPMSIQDWFPLGWLVWSPCSPRDSQESYPLPQFKNINSLALSLLYGLTLTSIITIGKTIALTRWTFAVKVMSLLFNMLSRFVIDFLSRSKCLLIS